MPSVRTSVRPAETTTIVTTIVTHRCMECLDAPPSTKPSVREPLTFKVRAPVNGGCE